jgi:alkylation response protein AidB-like acyl-CoA dehydrogenase
VAIQETMDTLFRLAQINLDGIKLGEEKMIGLPDTGWRLWTHAMRLAMLLACAELFGIMEKCLEMSVAFSKDRNQFGRSVGSFQALKHRFADALTDLEATRGLAYCAAWALDQGSSDAHVALASAKAAASDAGVRVTEQCLQSYGAMGFTWEHDVHLYLKRARRLEMSHGDAQFQRELVAAHYLSHPHD